MQKVGSALIEGTELGLGVDLLDEAHFADYAAPSRLRLQTGPGGRSSPKTSGRTSRPWSGSGSAGGRRLELVGLAILRS